MGKINPNEAAQARTGWFPSRADIKEMHQSHLEAISCLPTKGLTIRAEFAARFMQGLLSAWGQHDVTDKERLFEELAIDSVKASDALINELNKTDNDGK